MICLVQGFVEEGWVCIIEVNLELEYIIWKYLKKVGLEDKVEVYIGDVMQVIFILFGIFDLVFIDVGKQYYQVYYDFIIDWVEFGGLIIVDNVFWSGKVVIGFWEIDVDMKQLYVFNVVLQEDEWVDNLLLLICDGFLVACKW